MFLMLNQKVKKVVEILDDKKAFDINVIDIRKLSIITDYFVICSGTSSRHIKSLAEELEHNSESFGLDLLHKEGYNTAKWILLDYGEIVVHVLDNENREYYNLERLWGDGIVIKVENGSILV